MNYEVKLVFPNEAINYDFMKTYWRSLGYELTEYESSFSFIRGRKGYGFIGNNPLLMYSKIVISSEKREIGHIFNCQVEQEKSFYNSNIMEQIIKKEFERFEKLYNQSLTKNVFLENSNAVRMQMVWPAYIINLFFTGLGLFFTKRIDCIILGIICFIYYLYGIYDLFTQTQMTLTYSLTQFIDSIMFWYILSYIGHIVIRDNNHLQYLQFLDKN